MVQYMVQYKNYHIHKIISSYPWMMKYSVQYSVQYMVQQRTYPMDPVVPSQEVGLGYNLL